jgi:hypothetical protein
LAGENALPAFGVIPLLGGGENLIEPIGGKTIKHRIICTSYKAFLILCLRFFDVIFTSHF